MIGFSGDLRKGDGGDRWEVRVLCRRFLNAKITPEPPSDYRGTECAASSHLRSRLESPTGVSFPNESSSTM